MLRGTNEQIHTKALKTLLDTRTPYKKLPNIILTQMINTGHISQGWFVSKSVCFRAGVSYSFSLGATSALQLPSKGQM